MESKNNYLAGVNNEIQGLQRSVRAMSEQANQTLSLLGLVKQDLETEKAHVKRLQMEMEKVHSYLNQNRVP